MDKISGIYKIVNKIDGKYYVGSSNNITNRYSRHKRELSHNNHHCIRLQRAWNKYGKDNFDYIIIELVEPHKQTLFDTEQNYLDKSKLDRINCYNSSMTADIGDGFLGRKHSVKTKKKMSQSHKGIIFSNEHRKNISLCGKGKHGQNRSDETKKRISLSLIGNKRNVGKKHTEEWKQKMRERMIGNTHSKKKPSPESFTSDGYNMTFTEINLQLKSPSRP